jgi:hypothetical protein
MPGRAQADGGNTTIETRTAQMKLRHSRACAGLGAALAVTATATAYADPPSTAHGQPTQSQTAHSHPAHSAPADACGYTPTKAFSAFHDNKPYVLTQNGGFENGDSGWTLSGGASVVEGNETFALGGASDHQSLSLPAGSSATSPANCVSNHDGIVRAFARTTGDSSARLKVEVLYLDGKGKKQSRVAGKLRAGDAWQPTKRLAVALGRAKGHGKMSVSHVSFRFTPVGAGDWQIDDLYLDPRARG